MTSTAIRRFGAMAAVSALAVTAACDRDSVGPDDHESLGTVEIIDRSIEQRTVIATWTHDGGWDQQSLPELSQSAEDNRTRVSLGVDMFNRGDEEIALSRDGEFSARWSLAEDAPTGIVVTDDSAGDRFHGDHIHIYADGNATGMTEIEFILWHDGHADARTTPIGFTVTD